MSHADDHVPGTRLGGPLDREVQHGHQHVHALDREPLLAQVRLVEELLQGLDLGEAAEQRAPLLGGERLAVGAGLDLRPQPDALLVGRDVLDLVRHGSAVGGLEIGQRLGQRPTRHAIRRTFGGDRRHDLRREPQRRGRGRGRRSAGAKGIEVGGEVAVHSERLDQRHGGGDVVQHLGRDRPADSSRLAAGAALTTW